MEIDFSEGEEVSGKLQTVLGQQPGNLEGHELVFRRERIFDDLYSFTLVMKDLLSWTKNLGMVNKAEESKKFRKAWNNDETYQPQFRFKEFSYNINTVSRVIDQAQEATEMIDRKKLNEYPVETLTVEDLRNLFRGTFEEFRTQAQIAANIDNRERWRESCLEVWPVKDETFRKAVRKLEKDFNEQEEEKDLYADDVASMWREELQRMGIDYRVEIRNVPGCFNIPEEETVVVAKGADNERLYSRSEAEALTMHELFHVIRTYNGNRVMKHDLPPILGLHTPFYDRLEEGGAVYREYMNDVMTPGREKDYALRALAAYFTYQEYSFNKIVEKLVNHGASLQRAFALAARNREVLRHQIYLDGYYEWKQAHELWPMLLGKVNAEWAEKLRKEVNAGGIVKKPPVGPDQVFDHSI